MEGNRQNRVERAGGEEPPESVSEQTAEGGSQENLTAVLEPEEGIAQIAGIGAERADCQVRKERLCTNEACCAQNPGFGSLARDGNPATRADG